MISPLPLSELLDEWYRWAEWVSSSQRDEDKAGDLIGFDEFNWLVQDYPELAWEALLVALTQPRMEPHLGLLAAGPLEDLLSEHGERWIERVESEAYKNPHFARMLGEVWQSTMKKEIRDRVQKAFDSSSQKSQ